MAHQSLAWESLKAGAPPKSHSRSRWSWAIPVSVAALLAAAAFWRMFPVWNGANAPAASAPAAFSLALERAGSDYRVTWDAQSPVVRTATRGTLLIKDGSAENEVELDREQLFFGGVVYAPATTDVSFSLKVFGAGPEPTVANIRLLAGSRPQVAAAEAPIVETAPAVEQPADAPATMAAAPKPEDIPQPAQ